MAHLKARQSLIAHLMFWADTTRFTKIEFCKGNRIKKNCVKKGYATND